MKYLIIILIALLPIVALSQTDFPTVNNVSSPNTRVVYLGALQSNKGLINAIYTDTTAANSSYIKYRPGSFIFCSSDNSLWIRNNASNAWLQVLPVAGGGGFFQPNQISNGTTTHDANYNNFLLNNIGTLQFTAGTNGNYSQITQDSGLINLYALYNATSTSSMIWVRPDSIRLLPAFGILNIDSIAVGNAVEDSILTWNPATGRVGYVGASNFGGGGTNIYNSDGSLTNHRVLSGNGFNLKFDSVGYFEVVTNTFGNSQTTGQMDNDNFYFESRESGLNNYAGTYSTLGGGLNYSEIYSFKDGIGGTGVRSAFDKVWISQLTSVLGIDSLNLELRRLHKASTPHALYYNESTGQVTYDTASGGGGSGTTLTVKESDGSPSYNPITTLTLNANEFTLTNPTAPEALIRSRASVDSRYNVSVGTPDGNFGSVSTADTNIAVGYGNMIAQSGAKYNLAIGEQNLYRYEGTHDLSSGRGDNIAIGFQNMFKHSGGYDNIAIGYQNMYDTSSAAFDNIAIGWQTMKSCLDCAENVAMGDFAMTNLTTGTNNTAIGNSALKYVTTGGNNTFLGDGSALGITTGNNNTGVGGSVFNASGTSVGNSTGIGTESLSFTTGNFNTALGMGAGQFSSSNSGASNTFLGYHARGTDGSNFSNSTAIGANSVFGASNTIAIGTASEKTAIAGTTADSILKVWGSLNITTHARVQQMDSTNTPVNIVYQDVDGTLRKAAVPSGSGFTADNGLTDSVSKIILGGTLYKNTTITMNGNSLSLSDNAAAGTSIMNVSSTSTAASSNLQIGIAASLSGANSTSSQTTKSISGTNTHTGTSATNYGVYGEISNGLSTSAGVQGTANGSQYGVSGSSSSGAGVNGSSVSGIGIAASTISGTILVGTASPSSTNTVITGVSLVRNTSGTAADGIGQSIDFTNEATDGVGYLANRLTSKWVTAANATRTSKFIISGVNNSNTDDLLVLGDRVSLTESSATTFASTTVGSGQVAGGQIIVTIEANDGTDFQSRTLRFIWSAVNKGGTTTVQISTPEEQVATSTGTLTATITAVDGGSGVINFQANASSSLTQTTLRATYSLIKNF